MILRQGGGVLWIKWRRIAHGVKVGRIATKFFTSQNKQLIAYFYMYIFQDCLNYAREGDSQIRILC